LKIKGDTKYLYAIRDDQTRYLIAQQVSDSKFTADLSDLTDRVECLSNEIINLEGQKRNSMNKVIL
jgi:hypothetical protein